MNLDAQLRQCHECRIQGGYGARGFFAPADIVLLSAVVEKHHYEKDFISSIENDAESYLRTIGVYEKLWGMTDNWQRPNKGYRYATLAKLEDPYAVNAANDQLKSCINSNLPHDIPPASRTALNHVIGELHDNVWSHGKSTGFSMAQYYDKKKRIEFAVADLGGGFLSVLQNAGIDAESHTAAIHWCLQEGNSSVKEKQKRMKHDDFIQSLPDDFIGNPMGNSALHCEENHHQGFGLAELVKLVKNHHGELEIASGDTVYSIDRTGREDYLQQAVWTWPGVIISCRLYLDGLGKTAGDAENNDVNQILEIISGGFRYE